LVERVESEDKECVIDEVGEEDKGDKGDVGDVGDMGGEIDLGEEKKRA